MCLNPSSSDVASDLADERRPASQVGERAEDVGRRAPGFCSNSLISESEVPACAKSINNSPNATTSNTDILLRYVYRDLKRPEGYQDYGTIWQNSTFSRFGPSIIKNLY